MIKQFWSKDIIIYDLETTGTDGKEYDIIEIGACIMTKEGFIKKSTFHSYIQPLTDRRDPKAMEVNQIPETALESAPKLPEVLDDFEHWIFNIYPLQYENNMPSINLGCWGHYFDIPFLKDAYKRIARTYPFHYTTLCIKSMCNALTNAGDTKHLQAFAFKGIESTLKENGLKFTGRTHSALDDAVNQAKLLQYLQRSLYFRLIPEVRRKEETEEIFRRHKKCLLCNQETTEKQEFTGTRIIICEKCNIAWAKYNAITNEFETIYTI